MKARPPQIKDVAVPPTVLQTGPSAFRHFDLSANGNAYCTSTIVVNEGDVIDLNFTAVDKNYDMFLPDFGISKAAAKGETVKLQFEGYPFRRIQILLQRFLRGRESGRKTNSEQKILITIVFVDYAAIK